MKLKANNDFKKVVKDNNLKIKDDMASLNEEIFFRTIYCCLALRRAKLEEDLEKYQLCNSDIDIIERLEKELNEINQVYKVIINDSFQILINNFFSIKELFDITIKEVNDERNNF